MGVDLGAHGLRSDTQRPGHRRDVNRLAAREALREAVEQARDDVRRPATVVDEQIVPEWDPLEEEWVESDLRVVYVNVDGDPEDNTVRCDLTTKSVQTGDRVMVTFVGGGGIELDGLIEGFD